MTLDTASSAAVVTAATPAVTPEALSHGAVLPHAQVWPLSAADLHTLNNIQNRVLWLSTRMIHHANALRPNPDKSKVGGHQASSASMVSILTALYFSYLRAGDRVAVKPHASPAYHAVQYLLGRLDGSYLTQLRAYGGLQAYPSRTKDPDPVDFSTGSVGLGAAAPAFAALVERYLRQHFSTPPAGGLNEDTERRRRFVAIMGDAELDEGNIWEAVAEDHLRGLGDLMWVIDLNRQSLDRVIPGVRASQLEALFRASDWNVLEVKYGRRLQAAFGRPGGQALRRRIDQMSNQEYQATIRMPGAQCRQRLLERADDRKAVEAALGDVPDERLPALLSDLGGHDLAELLHVFNQAAEETGRPTVVFAYTIKGWGLPIAGHPSNHSALLSSDQIEQLRVKLGIPENDHWARFPAGSPEEQICEAAAERLREPAEPTIDGGKPALTAEQIPASINHEPLAITSTQETLGRLLFELVERPEIGKRIVTVAPDVAVSTNLGGWINKVGVYSAVPVEDHEPTQQAVHWRPSPQGQHIELGISEMNLFLLLGQLGLSQELLGQTLLPIGTVYDPFVLRGLDAFIYGLYNHARFIVAGTPSGLSLSPEGGAHQSTVTPSLGIGLPNLNSYEPTFAREVEWILLDALRQCLDRVHGRATYLRLSTKPIEQALFDPAFKRLGEEELRRQVLAGGYRLNDWRYDAPQSDPQAVVQIAAAGVMIPEAVAAAQWLHGEGVAANVLAITSADRLYAALVARQRAAIAEDGSQTAAHASLADPLKHLIANGEEQAPMVTVLDGASHTLTFLGGALGVHVVPLGVDDFGQSGPRGDLYRHYGIDTQAIISAAFQALDRV